MTTHLFFSQLMDYETNNAYTMCIYGILVCNNIKTVDGINRLYRTT